MGPTPHPLGQSMGARAVTLGSHAVTPKAVTLYAGIYLW